MIHPHSLQVADIDGDGNLDIFVAEMAKWTEDRPDPDNPRAQALIFFGDGKGSFRKTDLPDGHGLPRGPRRRPERRRAARHPEQAVQLGDAAGGHLAQPRGMGGPEAFRRCVANAIEPDLRPTAHADRAGSVSDGGGPWHAGEVRDRPLWRAAAGAVGRRRRFRLRSWCRRHAGERVASEKRLDSVAPSGSIETRTLPRFLGRPILSGPGQPRHRGSAWFHLSRRQASEEICSHDEDPQAWNDGSGARGIQRSPLLPGQVAAEEPAARDAFQQQVLPLLERYCIDCHSKESPEAGIVLDRFEDQAAAVKDGQDLDPRPRCARGAHHAAGRRCPSRRWKSGTAMVAWIENDFLAAQCGQQTELGPGGDPAAEPAGIQQYDPRPARAGPPPRRRLPRRTTSGSASTTSAPRSTSRPSTSRSISTPPSSPCTRRSSCPTPRASPPSS